MNKLIDINIQISNSRQYTFQVTINNEKIIYADISNNKKKCILNMEEIEENLKEITPTPIKQYNVNINESIDTNNNKLSILDKKILREKVQTLSKDECKIVFSIIRDDTDKYTENNNGIFINLDNISNIALHKIYKYVNKVTKNKINNETLIVHESTANMKPIIGGSKIKLSNYEISIIKRNNYMEEQKDFKNSNNWFIKKDAMGNDIMDT